MHFLQLIQRRVLTILTGVLGLSCCTILHASSPTYELKEDNSAGRLTRVQSVLEFTGQLKVNADGKRVIQLPLTGKGELVYDEKLLASTPDSAAIRAARYYRTATASSRIGEANVTTQLNADRRLVGAQFADGKITVFSPLGPMTPDELELLEVQGSTLLLGQLLPSGEVALGEKWKHDDNLAGALFGLEAVTKSNLESVLKKVEGTTAYMELSGTVGGSVGGVGTDLEVLAKYNFDLDRRCITWLAMSIKESRAIGHAEPGFDMTARLRVSVTAADEAPELADEALASLPLEANPNTTWLTLHSQAGGFRVVHDRNWRSMIDRADVTILRLIERGELIAQCNISRLPDAAPGKQLSMKSFQADIQRVLDKNFGQVVEATESKNEHGLRVLRTIVAGVTAELPIQWNYYHLTDEKGRQVSLVFTMDAKLVERFAAADQTMISSFEILEKATASESPAAKPAATTASKPEKQRAGKSR